MLPVETMKGVPKIRILTLVLANDNFLSCLMGAHHQCPYINSTSLEPIRQLAFDPTLRRALLHLPMKSHNFTYRLLSLHLSLRSTLIIII